MPVLTGRPILSPDKLTAKKERKARSEDSRVQDH